MGWIMVLPLRPNVCMFVVNSDGKVFLGERKGSPGEWQLPQGGIEDGQSEEEAVLRELEEELGVDKSLLKLQKRLSAINEYEFSVVPDYAKGKWRGQRQSFWVVKFLGDDSDIDLKRYTEEFSDYRWCSVDEFEQIAHPLRMEGYKNAFEEFKEWQQGSR